MKIKLNPEMSVVTFKLEEDLLQKLDLYAMKSGLTRSDVIREALESYDWGNKKKIMPIRIRTITVKLEGELLQKLDLYAVNARVTRSQVIREALKHYLSSFDGEGGEQ
jgi:metal-responsive CopG/Arc/MetJ family transcriptional regulator